MSSNYILSTCSSENIKGHDYVSCFSRVLGRGSRMVEVSDRGQPCHEFEPSTTKDPLRRAAMHVKYVESETTPVSVVW
ncbi:hypothetical protein TNCV_1088481 [Trichonephila clavipes]|uniref:Uncharacterized protein n=1 Tax=Trichonephila clavipes TaxID=2585209 RepID=A0A8X6SNK4_TRICX|nr:hypothetical protein TNCV_1088481 [Trichonephila clavipes]